MTYLSWGSTSTINNAAVEMPGIGRSLAIFRLLSLAANVRRSDMWGWDDEFLLSNQLDIGTEIGLKA